MEQRAAEPIKRATSIKTPLEKKDKKPLAELVN